MNGNPTTSDDYILNSGTEGELDEIENKPLEKQNFKWCYYLEYLICCEKTSKKINYYKEFRARLISEENIIQNYIDIYNDTTKTKEERDGANVAREPLGTARGL